MQNTFSVKIKKDGRFRDITGKAVFPFSFGELLDERLDEAYLRIIKDTTEHYDPLTEFKITLSPRMGETKDFYFIVGNDNSENFPLESPYYKHEIYLIERTKLLEGILCPSITFTNSKGADYSKITNRVYATVTEGDNIGYPGYGEIKSPVNRDKPLTIPSAHSVCEDYAQYRNDLFPARREWEPWDESGDQTTNVSIYFDDVFEYSTTSQNPITVPAEDLQNVTKITLRYELVFRTEQSQTQVGTIYTYPIVKISFEIYAVSDVLPLAPYTITDCVNRVLELAEPLRGTETPRYTFDGVSYGRIDGYIEKPYRQGSQAEYYDKVIAPEFSMTECTLREQLKVIGGYIHAEPYIDENDVVYFLDYGNTEQYKHGPLKFAYKAKKTDINQYCTEVRSTAKNLVNSMNYAKGIVVDPCGNLFRTVRSETMYARIEEGNAIVQTSMPIYAVEKIECNFASVAPTQMYDITPYVFEETEYASNLSSYTGGYPYSKSYALYYTIGSKNIKGLFFRPKNAIDTATFSRFAIANILAAVSGQDPENIQSSLVAGAIDDLAFRVTYRPIIPSSLVSHSKQYYISGQEPFAQIYNQSGNLIETEYFGENIKGVAARLGNVEETRTFIFEDIDKIPEVGQMMDGYAISAVNTEYMPRYIKCTVALTRDFNRISEYVGVSSVKRLYEISERQTYNRNVLYKETLVIGSEDEDTDDYTFFSLGGFHTVFAQKSPLLGSAKITGVAVAGTLRDAHLTPLGTKILPVASVSLGNAVTFSFAYKDNYSAGDISENVNTSFGISGRWQADTRYTDFYGRIFWLGFYMFQNATRASGVYDFAYTLPEASPGFTITDPPFKTDVRLLRLRKDNREIISVTCELEVKSADRNIIIGSGLADECRFVNDKLAVSGLELHLVKNGIYKFDKQYIPEDGDTSVFFDYQIANAFPFRDNITYDTDYYGRIISFTLPTVTVPNNTEGEYLGWVLCTASDPDTQKYTDETGEEVEYTTERGRKILLSFDATDAPISAGSTVLATSNGNPIRFILKR